MSAWLRWSEAMAQALYGDQGFYRRGDLPRDHFRTSVTSSRLFAEAIGSLVREVDELLGRPDPLQVVDVGAGDGGLLAHLATSAPERWELVAVELRPRPIDLPTRVQWRETPPESVVGVVVAHELLDNVPVDVVEVTPGGPRRVEVTADGSERLGDTPPESEAAWLSRWWPLARASAGDRADVGAARDAMWAALVGRLSRGLALAVDYSHTLDERVAGRWAAGTLTAYRAGRQVMPVPDGSCDLTAHVALDACAAAGTAAGAELTWLGDQRTALRGLGLRVELPDRTLAQRDPAAYLAAVSRASQAADLVARGGLGDFGWLLQTKHLPHLPLPVPSQAR